MMCLGNTKLQHSSSFPVGTTKTSLTLALISSILIVSTMQMWKTWLASSSQQTLLGGILGSFLFTFVLTAIGNSESLIFGRSYTVGLIPEGMFYSHNYNRVHFVLLIWFSFSGSCNGDCCSICC